VKARSLLTAGAALCALAGCSSTAPAPTPARPPAAAVPAPSASAGASLDPETLDATAGYLNGLGKLDTNLITDKSKALDQGTATCADIAAGKPAAEQASNVARRYGVDAARAGQILELARTALCLN